MLFDTERRDHSADGPAIRRIVDTLGCAIAAFDAEPSRIARALGMRVSVGDGNEALGHLGTAGFDVLVSDVQMPGLDGISLAEKAFALKPGLRVVMISGHAEILEKARGLQSGAVRCLAKPFSIEQLRKEIRELLG